MRYNRMVYPYQSGGGVYSQPIITGLNVNASPIIQAASMPIDGGLEGYMGIQHLRQRREQMEMQREQMAMQQDEFKQRMMQQEKENVVSTMKMLSTLRDDLNGVEVLPIDAKAYEGVQERFRIQELAQAAGAPGASTEAMSNYVSASSAMMGDPELRSMVQRKKESDANLSYFEGIDKSLYGYIDNYEEVMESAEAGAGVKRASLNVDAIKADADALRQSNLATQENQRLLREAEARKLEQEAAEAKALAPYQPEILKARTEATLIQIEKAKNDIEISRVQLNEYNRRMAGAKTDQEKLKIYNEVYGTASSTSQPSLEQQYVNARVADGVPITTAIKEAKNLADDAATTTNTSYVDISDYKSPVVIDGKPFDTGQLGHFFSTKIKVPDKPIDPNGVWGQDKAFTPASAGKSTETYTHQGYLYTNNPHALIAAGLTSEDHFYDGNVEKVDDQTWRVPFGEAAQPDTGPATDLSTFRLDTGVDLNMLSPRAKAVLMNFPPEFRTALITSGFRTEEENAALPGAAPNSYHKSGDAVDIRINSAVGGDIGKKLAVWLRTPNGIAWLTQMGYDARIHEDGVAGDHIHLEPTAIKQWAPK
jgi:hypothetical protein